MFAPPALLTLLSLAAPSAAAADRVFVSPFQARTRAAGTTADTLTRQVEEALAATEGISLTRVTELTPVSDMDARTYARTCPQGQFVGCAYVLGDSAGVRVTVAAAVERSGAQHVVEVHIIDMDQSEDVLAFDAAFAPEDEGVFAASLARLVAAVARGEAGLSRDIRATVDPTLSAREERDRAVAAAQLDALSTEIGGSDSVDALERRSVRREKISTEDLMEDLESEAAKPWERLSMSMDEYVKYRNSGLDLMEWRDRAAGRQWQLLVRGALGYGRGPSSGAYYALQARAADDLSVVETWAWQSANSGAGLNWETSVGVGLLPILEVGAHFGGLTGTFSLSSWNITEGQSYNEPEPTSTGNNVWYVGPQALVALMPNSRFRPVFGAEFRFWRGTSVSDKVDASVLSDLPQPAAPNMVTIGGRIGGEARLGDNLDLYVHAPFHMLVGGKTVAKVHQGSGYIETLRQPEEVGTFGAGVQFGVQTRFFGGARQKGNALDAYGDPD